MRRISEKKIQYGMRKLSIGYVSCVIGCSIFFGGAVSVQGIETPTNKESQVEVVVVTLDSKKGESSELIKKIESKLQDFTNDIIKDEKVNNRVKSEIGISLEPLNKLVNESNEISKLEMVDRYIKSVEKELIAYITKAYVDIKILNENPDETLLEKSTTLNKLGSTISDENLKMLNILSNGDYKSIGDSLNNNDKEYENLRQLVESLDYNSKNELNAMIESIPNTNNETEKINSEKTEEPDIQSQKEKKETLEVQELPEKENQVAPEVEVLQENEN